MLGSKERQPPLPTYMSDQQKGQYLRDLRKTRLERPTGSRPLPVSRYASVKRSEGAAPNATTTLIAPDRPQLQTSTSMPLMRPSQPTHRREGSTSANQNHSAGRPLARQPSTKSVEPRTISPTPSEQVHMVRRTPSMTYTVRGSRWMEKQEAQSIRQAMEDMAREDEARIHAAARDEAAELVWKHRHSAVIYANPDTAQPNPDLKRDYRSHLRKGSYRRSVSEESAHLLLNRRSVSGGSEEESAAQQAGHAAVEPRMMCSGRKVSPPAAVISVSKTRKASGPSYGGLAEAVKDDIERAHRRSSSGSRRILSGEKKLFMHPNDRIWEDPQEERTPKKNETTVLSKTVKVEEPSAVPIAEPTQPAYVRRNPFARVRMQADRLERSQSDSIITAAPRHRVEIQKNPPSQSRNAFYVSNVTLPPSPPRADSMEETVCPKDPSLRHSMEIRSDDIRAATSKPRKDYSPNLPRPTFVSDKPGRPIVSFKEPREIVLQEMTSAMPEAEPTKRSRASLSAQPPSPRTAPHPAFNPPSISVNSVGRAPIPTFNIPQHQPSSSVPTFNFPDDDRPIPTFAIEDHSKVSRATDRAASAIPVINVDAPSIEISAPDSQTDKNGPPTASRPSPHHAATFPLPKSTPHYTPSIRPSGALCAHCALPIAGRTLAASGERFHPACFNCHACNTNLELVAFYPEPETKRNERLSRAADPSTANSDPNDADSSLRFYCHLDFHEHFSPRCKSCKTPIEGEVILACGAEWHAGHFFCAQCGDPFDAATPFVEKDGYAWCVGCHTHRYSPKCRKCRKPVVETVVTALGAEWHRECFVCVECNAEFDDGRFFLRGAEQDPVCVACEERRLKA